MGVMIFLFVCISFFFLNNPVPVIQGLVKGQWRWLLTKVFMGGSALTFNALPFKYHSMNPFDLFTFHLKRKILSLCHTYLGTLLTISKTFGMKIMKDT